MAIERVGIYPNKTDELIGSALEIFPSDSAPALQFRFATQSNSWLTANIWISVDAVSRAGSEAINGFKRIGAAGASDIARTSLSTPTEDGGQYVYSIPLSSLSAVATLMGTLSYSTRTYDALRLTVEVRIVWGTGANDFTRGSSLCWIGFKPEFTATGAYFAPEGLSVTYTAADWGRPNDRWENNEITSDGAALVNAKSAWGTTGGAGVLTIPRNLLLRVPATGETLGGTFRMVGSWQGIGNSIGELDLTGVTVNNLTQVRKPAITAARYGTGVLVTVTAGTGTGVAPERIEVSMVGSTYSADRATLAPGESHLFQAVPAGISTEWQAVGIATVSGEEFASGPSTATAQAVVIDGLEIVDAEANVIPIPYNVRLSSSSKPETETVKLAGRTRPTVGYGEGGEVSWTINGTIVTETMGDLTVTDPDTVRALPFAGVCIVRIEDGQRMQVSIESASVTQDGDGMGIMSATINADEVS